jgi:uncharacterized protein (DUF1499 family)
MTTEPAVRPPPAGTRRNRISVVAVIALVLAIVTALTAMLSGFGYQWGLWHFSTGFTYLRYAAYGGMATMAVAAVALVVARPGSGRRGFSLALVALVIGAAVTYIPWQQRRIAQSVPPIHDITTDTENPPQFVAIAPLRADAPNPVEYAGEETAQRQRTAYPDLRPMILDLPADQAFQRALDVVNRQGWQLVDADQANGRIEATDRTRWFGFYDDVVIRLTPMDGRTVVDVRSKSRVGRSDVGANARRIRGFLSDLER